MGFEVTILGNSSASFAHGRHHSAQVVQLGKSKIMLDCGEGTQIRMHRLGIKPTGLNTICISHLHADHTLGLFGLLGSFSMGGRNKPITLIGPLGLKQMLQSQFFYSQTYINYPIQVIELTHAGSQRILTNNDFTIDAFPLRHRLPTYGYLITEHPKKRKLITEALPQGLQPEHYQQLIAGHSITLPNGQQVQANKVTHPAPKPASYAYCTDTAFFEQLANYIKNCNMLYHDATFAMEHADRTEATGHSTTQQAAQMAQMAQAKQLLIGHFSARYANLQPLLAEAKAVFANTLLAQEGKVFNIG